MFNYRLVLANCVSSLLPQTRCFKIRRLLYSLAGVDVAGDAKINGRARIHYKNVKIGSNTWIGTEAQVISTHGASVEIGDNCDLGPQVMLVVGSHLIGPSVRRAGKGASVAISVGSGTWVGARATFLAGARVGSGCVVAAGSVVKDVFGDNLLLAGVPARVIRQLETEPDAIN